jgi:DNA-binding protein YbaB
MLEDLIKAALNDAGAKAEELQRQKLPQGVNGLM